ncbi:MULTISPECIES: GNAT family N-acetyltransferase [unclassified Devosia]|uniref:GNAT family N-acetyltransferase n=1 Tax=unclassified Devosia TaxID=196773 RepID=UPI0015525208
MSGRAMAPQLLTRAGARRHSHAQHVLRLPVAQVPRAPWEALGGRSLEPNGFFDHGFAQAASRHAWNGRGNDALVAFDGASQGRMLAFLPVVSAWAALRLPVPALVARQPYTVLSSPLLDPERAVEAAGALIDGAAGAGAHLLVLPFARLQGATADAIAEALARRGIAPAEVDNAHERAAYASTGDVESYLRGGMGAKRLKEMRRLRHRLDDEGAVAFTVADRPDTIAPAVQRFLALEASGWKGKQGTGLAQAQGDARFVELAALDMGARGGFEVAELQLDGRTIAAGLVLKGAGQALFFKIAYDESMGRVSPGVQLTLEMTRRFAENPEISFVDSTAAAGHPMIDHIWRERLAVGDLLIATRPNDPLAAGISRLVIGRRRARERAKSLLLSLRNRKEKRL